MGSEPSLARAAVAGCGRPRQAIVRRVARLRGPVRQVSRIDAEVLWRVRELRAVRGRLASGPAVGRAGRRQAADLHRSGPRGHRASDEDELSAGLQGRDRRSSASDDAERGEQRAEDARRAVAAEPAVSDHVAAFDAAADGAQSLPEGDDSAAVARAGDRVAARARAGMRSSRRCSSSPAGRHCVHWHTRMGVSMR